MVKLKTFQLNRGIFEERIPRLRLKNPEKQTIAQNLQGLDRKNSPENLEDDRTVKKIEPQIDLEASVKNHKRIPKNPLSELENLKVSR